MIKICFLALISHWRRQPMQLLALVLGLAVATALWSGVQAVNGEAKASYNRAAALLGENRFSSIQRDDGMPLQDTDFAALRRAGWHVSPVLEGRLRLGDKRYRLIGIDPLTLPNGALAGRPVSGADDLTKFMIPPYQILAAENTLLGLPTDGIPPVKAAALPPDILLIDIGAAQRLLQQYGEISRMIVAPQQKPTRLALAQIDPALVLRAPDQQSALGSLTDSFHLNLTAFGLMAFVVGLFIVHATITLAFEQRRALIRTLRALGVPLKTLIWTLLLELLLISGLSGLIGISLGYWIAATLLPDVAASLSGLYGASVPGSLSLPPIWWLGGLVMSITGAVAAATGSFWKLYKMSILDPAKAQAWLLAAQSRIRLQSAGAALCLVVALTAFILGQSLLAGFIVMGGVLLGAALILPTVISVVVDFMAHRAKGPVSQWFWADTRTQLNGLSLALMSLLLALSINIGVGAMVGGFRITFLQWLDQRLAAELYITGRTDTETAAISKALEARSDVLRVLPIWGEEIQYHDWPVTLYGFRDDLLYHDNWPLLFAQKNVWDQVAKGQATLISEQFARRFDLDLGDNITLPGQWTLPIAGIYADYGNPVGAAMVNIDPFLSRFPNVEKHRIGVRTQPGTTDSIATEMIEQFNLRSDQVINQTQLKAFSRGIFEKTFSITDALNILTLAVAGLALLISLLTLAQIRLPQLAPVWAMGLTRRRLGWIELVRSLMLALITAIMAIPLGVVFAWILTNVINVRAFGWKLPLYHFPTQWLVLIGLALLTAGISTLLPVIKLQRMPPARLLRLFSNER